jgi:hypothetical protein
MRSPPRLARRVLLVAGVASGACGGGPPAPKVSAVPVTRVPVEDSEPEDGVQVVSDKGHLDPSAVEAGIARHRDALTSCYTQKVGRRTWLGGHVVLRWEIAADGTVAKVLLAESDLGAWPVESCLLDIAREATFGKPIGGDAELTLPFEFSARGTPATWDDAQAAKAVGGQLGKLDACARGKIAMPQDVLITMYVGPHGRAASVGFASATTLLEEDWATCAEQAALGWHLPDPKGQVTKLAVRYRPR